MKRIIVLTGAGISAESGISTFRDAGGLWEGHDVMEVASPGGWERNPALVLDFYNQRRRHLDEVIPNAAHHALVELEQDYEVIIITQNVDDLHERAGSTRIIHLHGELRKMRSSLYEKPIYNCPDDIRVGDLCARGTQLRPHIVWFGEMVPMMEVAAREILTADITIIIGTSMQVYPAASLVGLAPKETPIYYIDPKPTINRELAQRERLHIITERATVGMPALLEQLREQS